MHFLCKLQNRKYCFLGYAFGVATLGNEIFYYLTTKLKGEEQLHNDNKCFLITRWLPIGVFPLLLRWKIANNQRPCGVQNLEDFLYGESSVWKQRDFCLS